jgi:hypothetical protein
MYESRSTKLLPLRQFLWRVARHSAAALALVLGSLLVGMAGYMHWAHMNRVDAFLNSAMLLGGMGPVGELSSDAAKIFAGCYALYAGLVFIASAGIIIAPVAHRIVHRLHAGPKD